MAKLGVNIDHIATLREARKVHYPDPVEAAKLAEDAGADQITCHLREDRRHIQDRDLPAIQAAIHVPLNLEMAATDAMLKIALELKPERVTLVPEKRKELTTEGGLEIVGQVSMLTQFVNTLQKAKIPVSLFIDPDEKQILASHKTGAQAIELNTGAYCNATGPSQEKEFLRIKQAALLAKDLGFFIAAGHGLHYENIQPFKNIPQIEEYNIGHSIVAYAVLYGWQNAVSKMKALLLQ